MIRHTPGPWKNAGRVGAGIWITDESSNNQIAMVYGEGQTKESAANAQLIAAAPELLEALKLIKEDFVDSEGCYCGQIVGGTHPEDGDSLGVCGHCKATKVIAKAEGRA